MNPIFFYCLLPFFLLACTPATMPPDVTPQTKIQLLRVGTLYSPQIYQNTVKGTAGFDYDMAKRFADYLHVPLKMVPHNNHNELYRALLENDIDIIAAGITDNPKLRKYFSLGPSLYQVDQLLVYARGHRYPNDLNQLSGDLMVTSDPSVISILNEYQKDHPELNWDETENKDVFDLLAMIIDKKLEYTVINSSVLDTSRRYMPSLRAGRVLKHNQHVVWLLPKNNSHYLMQKLLHFWDKEQQSDTLDILYERYFGHVKRFDYVDTQAFIRAVKKHLPKYQHHFKRYAEEIDWLKLAAISYQESHWDPKARSPTGVRGMMMLTRPTAKQMGVYNRLDAEQSIRGGAKYLRQLLKRLPDTIPESHKIWFALASYNIGFGHLNDAIKLTKEQGLNENSWADVKQVLPLLEKRQYYSKTTYGYADGSQAVHYVDNIRRYYDTLVWLHKNKLKQQHIRSLSKTSDKN